MTDESEDRRSPGDESGDRRPPVKRPERVDPKWHEKIERAQRARELGQRLRAGKPKSFRRSVGRAQ